MIGEQRRYRLLLLLILAHQTSQQDCRVASHNPVLHINPGALLLLLLRRAVADVVFTVQEQAHEILHWALLLRFTLASALEHRALDQSPSGGGVLVSDNNSNFNDQ